jgi:hypothetical protein
MTTDIVERLRDQIDQLQHYGFKEEIYQASFEELK